MITKLRRLFHFFNDQGAFSISHIPPLNVFNPPRSNYLNMTIPLFPNSSKTIFLFTVDDVWEKSNVSHLRVLSKLLASNNIKGTFFVTPSYHHINLSKRKALQIKNAIKGHEIAQHGVWHTRDIIHLSAEKGLRAIKNGKELLEKRFKTKILGYRSPDFLRNKHLLRQLLDLNFIYNSDQFLFRPNPFFYSGLSVIPVYDKCDPFALGLNENSIIRLIISKINDSIKYGRPYVLLAHSYDLNKKSRLKILDTVFSYIKGKKIPTNFSMSGFAKWWIARMKLQVKIIIKNKTQSIYLTNPTPYQLKNLPVQIYPLKGIERVNVYSNNKKVFGKSNAYKNFEIKISV